MLGYLHSHTHRYQHFELCSMLCRDSFLTMFCVGVACLTGWKSLACCAFSGEKVAVPLYAGARLENFQSTFCHVTESKLLVNPS